VGFAGANNRAIPLSLGRYVLLLNSDTEVRPGALTAMVGFLDQTPGAGAAGSRLTDPDGALQLSCDLMPTLFREFWRLFHFDKLARLASYDMRRWDLGAAREVDTVQGACLLLRREALDGVGLLDERFFMYSEEIDLCFRLRRAGWAVYWVPQAAVVHYGGQSTRQASTEMFLQLYRSKYLFFRKTAGAPGGLAFKIILLAASTLRIGLSPLTCLFRSPREEQLLAKASQYRQLVAALRTM
jgi:GT2 family glycosyltransferase